MALWKIEQSVIDHLNSEGASTLQEIVIATTDELPPRSSNGSSSNLDLANSYIKISGVTYPGYSLSLNQAFEFTTSGNNLLTPITQDYGFSMQFDYTMPFSDDAMGGTNPNYKYEIIFYSFIMASYESYSYWQEDMMNPPEGQYVYYKRSATKQNDYTSMAQQYNSPWWSNTAYTIGDKVFFSGGLYSCTVDHTSEEFGTSPDITKFNLDFTSGAPLWESGVSYLKGDLVIPESAYRDPYVCLADHTSADFWSDGNFAASASQDVIGALYTAGIDIPTEEVVLVGDKALAEVSVDPTVDEVTYNGQPLPTGSVLRNTTDGQKFVKIAGDSKAFTPIEITPKVAWDFTAGGVSAWAYLQGK